MLVILDEDSWYCLRNCLVTVHHCLGFKFPCCNDVANFLKCVIFEERTKLFTLLRWTLNASQLISSFLDFARLCSLFRKRISLRISLCIHGGSRGLIVTFLFGIA